MSRIKLLIASLVAAVVFGGAAMGASQEEYVPGLDWAGALPDGWYSYVAEEGEADFKVVEEGPNGKKAILIEADAQYAGASTPHDLIDKNRRYSASAMVKIDGKPGSSASVKIDYYDSADTWIADSVASLPAGTEGWHTVGVLDDAAMHEEARQIAISVSVVGEAQAWFVEPKFFSRPAEPDNLLANGHVETVGIDGVAAGGWTLSAADLDNATMKAVEVDGADGRFAIQITGTDQEWMSAVPMAEPIKLEAQSMFHLTGRAKATSGTAQLMLVYFENGEFIGASPSPAVGEQWTEIEVFSELENYENATHIVPAAFGIGNVEAWFDSMKLTAD